MTVMFFQPSIAEKE